MSPSPGRGFLFGEVAGGVGVRGWGGGYILTSFNEREGLTALVFTPLPGYRSGHIGELWAQSWRLVEFHYQVLPPSIPYEADLFDNVVRDTSSGYLA